MNNRNKFLLFISAAIVILIVELAVIIGANFMYIQVDPQISPISHTDKTWTFEWDGSNSTLTISSQGQNKTIATTYGQQFTCDSKTSIYENNRIIYQVP